MRKPHDSTASRYLRKEFRNLIRVGGEDGVAEKSGPLPRFVAIRLMMVVQEEPFLARQPFDFPRVSAEEFFAFPEQNV